MYASKWVVDRKFWEGVTWVLRFTRCGNHYCRRCAAGQKHGPYWARYVETDGRNHLQHHPTDAPLPWGENPPPSISPSDQDPNSRRSRRRAARAALEAAKAQQQAAKKRARLDQLLAKADGPRGLTAREHTALVRLRDALPGQLQSGHHRLGGDAEDLTELE